MHARSSWAIGRRRYLSVAAAAVLLAPAGGSAASPSDTPVTLVSTLYVELPDARILSMSPDGRSIAALRPAVGYNELCVFDTATLSQTACASLTSLDAGLDLDSVVWSPDSAHLAFTEKAFVSLRDGDLWLVDAATGALTNLDDDGYSGPLPFGGRGSKATITVDASPTFTPDGSTVTFSRSTIRGGEMAGNDIAAVPITGGPATSLVEVSPEAPGLVTVGMEWAPDGSRLYYSVDDVSATSPLNGIWTVEADGTGRRLLAGTTDSVVGEPTVTQLASAGTRLLAGYPRSFGYRSAPYSLSLIDALTGAASPVLPDGGAAAASGAVIQMATFSPDGSQLLEVTRNTDPNLQVVVRDLASGLVSPLIPDGLPTAGPSQRSKPPTWASNWTVLLPGGGALNEATLLTLDGGLTQ